MLAPAGATVSEVAAGGPAVDECAAFAEAIGRGFPSIAGFYFSFFWMKFHPPRGAF